MKEPVIVIHGIANRDEAKFKDVVNNLGSRVGKEYDLIDVFWGNLGGNANGLQDTLPIISRRTKASHGLLAEEDFFDLMLAERQALIDIERSRTNQEIIRTHHETVVDTLYRSIIHTDNAVVPLRAEMAPDSSDDLYQVLSEEIPKTQYIQILDEYPELLPAVGDLIADYLHAEQSGGGIGFVQEKIVTHGWVDDGKDAVKGFIGKIDSLVGRMMSNLAGSANQRARGILAEPIALTLGDIVAYHQRRREIHKRLFEVLDERAGGFGTADKPITVMAHSLGGLVTLDAALGSRIREENGSRRKLHIKHWITFGSQPAFFHVLAPRKGIDPYVPGNPVRLPSSIGSWTNLWHPMDVMAFSATRVFRLSNGNTPVDVRVDTSASETIGSKGWLHSSYWISPQLVAALKS